MSLSRRFLRLPCARNGWCHDCGDLASHTACGGHGALLACEFSRTSRWARDWSVPSCPSIRVHLRTDIPIQAASHQKRVGNGPNGQYCSLAWPLGCTAFSNAKRTRGPSSAREPNVSAYLHLNGWVHKASGQRSNSLSWSPSPGPSLCF